MDGLHSLLDCSPPGLAGCPVSVGPPRVMYFTEELLPMQGSM